MARLGVARFGPVGLGMAWRGQVRRGEVHRNMALLGVNSLAELGPERLMRIGGSRAPGMPL